MSVHVYVDIKRQMENRQILIDILLYIKTIFCGEGRRNDLKVSYNIQMMFSPSTAKQKEKWEVKTVKI